MEFYLVLGSIVFVIAVLLLSARAMGVPIEIIDSYNANTNNAHLGQFNPQIIKSDASHFTVDIRH